MLRQTTHSFSDMDVSTWYTPYVFALAEAGVVNKAGFSQLGVLLPQGLKQLPSDSEAAERKRLHHILAHHSDFSIARLRMAYRPQRCSARRWFWEIAGGVCMGVLGAYFR